MCCRQSLTFGINDEPPQLTFLTINFNIKEKLLYLIFFSRYVNIKCKKARDLEKM